jgi:colanic acid/amylovoran biosynthesis glycosyltransferase
MNNENKLHSTTLFILVDDFPLGPTEPYLIEEVPELEKVFSRLVFITTSPKLKNFIPRPNHFHLNLESQGIDKLLALSGFFYAAVRQECLALLKQRQLSVYKLKLLLANFHQALKLKKQVKALQTQHFPNQSYAVYAYWCDERAVACAMLKEEQAAALAITRAHGWDIYTERSPENYLPYRKWLLANLDKMICISANGKAYLEKKHGEIGKTKTEVFRLGTLALSKIPEKKPNQIFTILSLAYVVPLKRLHKIAQALALSDQENIRWIHLGGGPGLEELKETCQTLLGAKPTIQLDFLGSLPHDKILHFLQENYIDLFINVSETEGLPVSIMEAMSAQIPCLATDVGGSAEIVAMENGYLMPVDLSDKQLWDKILQHYQLQPDLAQKMRLAAYKTWEEKYDAQKNYRSFAKRLIELLPK